MVWAHVFQAILAVAFAVQTVPFLGSRIVLTCSLSSPIAVTSPAGAAANPSENTRTLQRVVIHEDKYCANMVVVRVARCGRMVAGRVW